MKKYKIDVSPQFQNSLKRIFSTLNKNQINRLADALDNLNQMLSIFPENFPIVQFEKDSEIPYRKAVIGKRYVVIYFFQYECIYLINLSLIALKIGNQK
jgi:addiction module RelE/StbE family toxin